MADRGPSLELALLSPPDDDMITFIGQRPTHWRT